MGSVVSSAANGGSTLVGNVVSAPFKILFGASCKSVCSGTWDLPCFIEHVCIYSLLRLFVVIIVTYIVLLFGYILCKLGIIKCVAKNAFKMACSACCGALGLLWQKVHRGRRGRRERDVELGEPSSTSRDGTGSSSSSSDDDDGDRCRGTAAGNRLRGRSLLSSSSSRPCGRGGRTGSIVPAPQEGQLRDGARCEGKPGEWTTTPPLELDRGRAEENGGAAVLVITA